MNLRKQSCSKPPLRGLEDCLQTVLQCAPAAPTTAALLFPHFFVTTRKYFRSFTLRCYARITLRSIPFVGVLTAESIPRTTDSKTHDNCRYLYMSRQKHFSIYPGRWAAFSSNQIFFYLLMGHNSSSHHCSLDAPSHKLDLNKFFISDHTQTRHLAQLPSAQGQNTWMLSHMGHGLCGINLCGL